ncbi:hypothetical protein [Sphingomonas sp. 35-24ZXX]|nr:hypothetical protein [Sphingomonas sp. 35-24ZXX]
MAQHQMIPEAEIEPVNFGIEPQFQAIILTPQPGLWQFGRSLRPFF